MKRKKKIEYSFKGFFTGEQCFGAVGMHNLSRPLADAQSLPQKVIAYHTFLPLSHYGADSPEELNLAEFELLTAELSARLWKKYNGPIYMLTDALGAEYFRQRHFEDIYDGILPILDARNFGIDLNKYWAFGKIQALTKIKAPCAIIDLDMLIWKPLNLMECGLAATHIEHLNEWLYPDTSFFIMSPKYQFPQEWNYSIEPLNTSFVYFADDALKEDYTQQSIRFMQYERDTPNDGFSCMIFAEQRILTMCAAQHQVKVKTFLDYDNLSAKQDIITHLWSGKKLIRLEKSVEKKYITLCQKKIDEIQERAYAWTHIPFLFG